MAGRGCELKEIAMTAGRRRFRPDAIGPLEDRVVLSRAAGFAPVGIAPVQVAPVDVSGRGTSLVRAVNDAINVAFESFKRDYLESQAAYFASNVSITGANQAQQLFRSFITQRLNLLNQELTRIFVQVPGGLNRISSSQGNSLVVQSFLRNRINGPGQLSLERALIGRPTPNGTGGVIPLVGTVSGSGITLYTNQALAAIDSARAATINATSFLLNDTFKNGHR